MLSPEICNFKAPDSFLKTEKHTSNNSCFQTIQKLSCNHLVSIVLPNLLCTPTAVCELIKTNCEYYKVANFSPVELSETKFIDNFVKKGTLIGLSINKNVDTDDCFCVVDGLMILSLSKESYETFGIEGTVSNFYCKSKERYIVHINLLSNALNPGTKQREKIKQCLSRLKNVSLIINWESPQDDICPSSIAKYFFDLSYDVKLCMPECNVRTSYSVKVPALNNIFEFVEWLGMFSLEIDSENCDDYLTTYETPTPYQEYGQMKSLQARGFFSCTQLQKLAEMLMTIVKREDIPWASLYVQGFSDSPIGWNAEEHHYYTNGDNSYLIIITSENYWITSLSCSRKCYK